MGTGDQTLEARESRYHKKMARQVAKKGEVLLDLDDQFDDPRQSDVVYTDLRVRLGDGSDPEVLVILKRTRAGEKEIAFHYAQGVGAGLEGLVGRLKNGSLKWREDKPYVDS